MHIVQKQKQKNKIKKHESIKICFSHPKQVLLPLPRDFNRDIFAMLLASSEEVGVIEIHGGNDEGLRIHVSVPAGLHRGSRYWRSKVRHLCIHKQIRNHY